jgi:hypothetical protein
MSIHDSLNNQFRLYHKLNSDTIQYIENNNLNVNYYCFYEKIIDCVQYIITSNTTKRKDNGYRKIIITKCDFKNQIIEYNGYINIYYEGIYIKISSILHSDELGIRVVSEKSNKILYGTADFKYYNDKDVNENSITSIINYDFTGSLYNFNNLQYLELADFCKLTRFEMLPNSLFTLILSFNYNSTIKENMLPKSLIFLTFGYYYNQPLNQNVLPNSLLRLTFGSYYDQLLNQNVLPNSLQHLTFGKYYNQPLNQNVLPNSLVSLTFGCRYNQQLSENVLPNSLKTLIFGLNYDRQFTENVLPIFLHTLTLSLSYYHKININVIPYSLRTLILKNYRLSFDNKEVMEHVQISKRDNIVPTEFKGAIHYTDIDGMIVE